MIGNSREGRTLALIKQLTQLLSNALAFPRYLEGARRRATLGSSLSFYALGVEPRVVFVCTRVIRLPLNTVHYTALGSICPPALSYLNLSYCLPSAASFYFCQSYKPNPLRLEAAASIAVYSQPVDPVMCIRVIAVCSVFPIFKSPSQLQISSFQNVRQNSMRIACVAAIFGNSALISHSTELANAYAQPQVLSLLRCPYP